MSGTLVIALCGLAIALVSLGWNIVSWILERRSNRPSVVTSIVGMEGQEAVVTFTNVSPSHARSVSFLMVEGGRRYAGHPLPDAHVAPGETKQAVTPFDMRPGRMTLLWAWLDEKGNVYARNNDGDRVRYGRDRARREQVTLDTLFRSLYPNEQLPIAQGTPIRMSE